MYLFINNNLNFMDATIYQETSIMSWFMEEMDL